MFTQDMDKYIDASKETSAELMNLHRRTISNIPQFDGDDADSIGSFSMNSTFDQDVFETVQSIVDSIAGDHDKGVSIESNSSVKIRTNLNIQQQSKDTQTENYSPNATHHIRGIAHSSSSVQSDQINHSSE